jgi:hypothetical protein
VISAQDAEARVAKGAAHLDQVRPGWASRIDVGTLTLHDPCGCIVGQLCGSSVHFAWGLSTLDVLVDLGEHDKLGFDVGEEICPSGMSRREWFAPLQDAWIKEIARRLHPVTEASTLQPVTVTA